MVFKIGLWGTSGAGKTTYLAMLYQELLADPAQWVIRADEPARQFLEQTYKQMYEGHIFPEKTVNTQIYRYHVTRQRDSRAFELEFLDAAGELYEAYFQREQRTKTSRVAQRGTTGRETDQTPQDIFLHLRTCDGILFCLDPSWSKQRSYAPLVWQVLEDLREDRLKHRVRRVPLVALVVTKADADDAIWQQRHLDGVSCDRARAEETACHERCPVYRQMTEVFMRKWLHLHPPDHVRCFVVSSIGRRQDDRLNVGGGYAWERELTPRPTRTFSHPPVSYAGLRAALSNRPTEATFSPRSISEPRAISPFGLQAPIAWMLEMAASRRVSKRVQ